MDIFIHDKRRTQFERNNYLIENQVEAINRYNAGDQCPQGQCECVKKPC